MLIYEEIDPKIPLNRLLDNFSVYISPYKGEVYCGNIIPIYGELPHVLYHLQIPVIYNQMDIKGLYESIRLFTSLK